MRNRWFLNNYLKAHDDLDFHWVERLDNQDSNNLVGLFSFRELDSADRLDAIYFGDSFSPGSLVSCWENMPGFSEISKSMTTSW